MTEKSSDKDVQTLADVNARGMEAMRDVYVEYRQEFMAFSSRYTQDEDLRMQSLHDAIIQLYEAIVSNSYDNSKSSIKTYLFNLGKYRLINRLKKDQTISKYISFEDKDPMDNQSLHELNEEIELEVKESFAMLSDKCRDLLVHIYYENLPADVVLERMKYENQNVLYASKSRCLKKLKELIQEKRARLKVR